MAHTISALYHKAGELEKELWETAQGNPFAEMTPAQAHAYNDFLRQTRQALPDTDGFGEANEETLVSEAHQHLRVNLVPALVNALPQP
jgi:DNA-directed RNA polymerase specialized sigma54-like protein